MHSDKYDVKNLVEGIDFRSIGWAPTSVIQLIMAVDRYQIPV